jgi:hypothetical protein
VDELAARLRELATDAAARTRLGRRARAIALDRFDDRRALVRYRALLAEVARGGASLQLASR